MPPMLFERLLTSLAVAPFESFVPNAGQIEQFGVSFFRWAVHRRLLDVNFTPSVCAMRAAKSISRRLQRNHGAPWLPMKTYQPVCDEVTIEQIAQTRAQRVF